MTAMLSGSRFTRFSRSRWGQASCAVPPSHRDRNRSLTRTVGLVYLQQYRFPPNAVCCWFRVLVFGVYSTVSPFLKHSNKARLLTENGRVFPNLVSLQHVYVDLSSINCRGYEYLTRCGVFTEYLLAYIFHSWIGIPFGYVFAPANVLSVSLWLFRSLMCNFISLDKIERDRDGEDLLRGLCGARYAGL